MSDDLSRVMRSAAEGLHPNIGKLTAGGVERGVRKRRMRRTAQAVGAAASVTAVFGAVTAVAPHGSGPDKNVSAAGGAALAAAGANGGNSAPTSAPTTEAGSGHTSPKGNVAAPAQLPDGLSSTIINQNPDPNRPSAPPVTDQDMVHVLQGLLAATHVQGYDYIGVGSRPATNNPADVDNVVRVSARLKDSGGISSIAVSVFGNQSATEIAGKATKLSDGSTAWVDSGPEYSDGRNPGEVYISVTIVRPDGTWVAAVETNAPSEKAAATAKAPAFNAEQLTKMLDNSAWDAAVAAANTAPVHQHAPLSPADAARDKALKNGAGSTTTASPGSAH